MSKYILRPGIYAMLFSEGLQMRTEPPIHPHRLPGSSGSFSSMALVGAREPQRGGCSPTSQSCCSCCPEKLPAAPWLTLHPTCTDGKPRQGRKAALWFRPWSLSAEDVGRGRAWGPADTREGCCYLMRPGGCCVSGRRCVGGAAGRQEQRCLRAFRRVFLRMQGCTDRTVAVASGRSARGVGFAISWPPLGRHLALRRVGGPGLRGGSPPPPPAFSPLLPSPHPRPCRPSPRPQHAPCDLCACGNSWLHPLPCGRRATGHRGQVEQGRPPPAG